MDNPAGKIGEEVIDRSLLDGSLFKEWTRARRQYLTRTDMSIVQERPDAGFPQSTGINSALTTMVTLMQDLSEAPESLVCDRFLLFERDPRQLHC